MTDHDRDDSASVSTCGSTDTCDGTPCQRPVDDDAVCFLHSDGGPPADHGAPEGNTNGLRNDGGAPPANGNAERHGLYADRSKYYQRLDDDEQAWVDALVDGWLSEAPFGRENIGGLELLRKVAIDEHKRRRANDYIAREGVVTENVVGYDDDGDPVVKKEENPANLPYSRMAKDTIRTLKELNVLDSPDSRLAENAGSWTDAARAVAMEQDRDQDQERERERGRDKADDAGTAGQGDDTRR
jgi:hypothetical protein